MLPLKELEKLTVVKLRAELMARGLDSKGNKPFLVERLRIALEQEELSGEVRPEIKMHTSETDPASADVNTQDDHPDVDQMEAQTVETADLSNPPNHSSTHSSPTKSSNGVTEGALNNTPPLVPVVLKADDAAKPAVITEPEILPVDKPKVISDPPSNEDLDRTDPDTSIAPNDSIMAVYGGKDETFAMEDSVLDQSTVTQPQDTSIANTVDLETSLTKTSPVKVPPLVPVEKQSEDKQTVESTECLEAAKTNLPVEAAKADLPVGTTKTDLPEEASKTDLPMESAPSDCMENGDEKEASHVMEVEKEKSEDAADVKMELAATAEETDGTSLKSGKTEDKSDRGSKRHRDRSSSPSSSVNKASEEGPPPEDEPTWDVEQVLLDWYNSDLNLTISKTDFMSAAPLTDGGFAYMWAGVRATYGFLSGKLCYEVKVVEHLPIPHIEESETNPHVIRVGWSVDSTSFQLGEEPLSCGYGGTGKISQNMEFTDYGVPFQLNDVVGVYMDASDDKDVVELSFTVNGVSQGVAFTLKKEDLNSRPLFPHILTKNCRFEVNFGQKEEPWFPAQEGFEWASKAPTESRVRGVLAPASRAECEMIMMCGLPGAGKTTWANKFTLENPEKKFNVIGTNAFLEKMKVNGLPRRKNYNGRWEVLIEKCTRCLNILLEIAAKRRRNFILDQTNVYPTAQKRKMSYFAGFQRKAVVIVPSEEEAKTRAEKRIQEEGKDVPDTAVMEMKANFKMPTVDETFSVVEFPELAQEEAQKVIDKYSAEAKAAGFGQPSPKRQRQNYGGGGRSKNDRGNDSRRHGSNGSRDRSYRDSRGPSSSNHRSPGHRSSYRDSRDDRYRPPPPPSHWRGGNGGPPPGRGGWNNRGPPPPPMHRNGPYSPHRRGPPPGPPGPLMGRGGGGWNPQPLDRSYGPPRSGGGGGGGGGGGRSYDDRRNDRSPYPAPRRDGGPSLWMGSSSMSGGSAPPSRSGSWGSGSGGGGGGGGGWGGSSSASYGQQPSSYSTGGSASAYSGSSLYGSGAGSARPSAGGYGSSGSSARPAAGYGGGNAGNGGAGITGLARPAGYGSNGQAGGRPVAYGSGTTSNLQGARSSSYGAPAGGGAGARPSTSYPAVSANPWAQQQQQPISAGQQPGQQSQQTLSGYAYPYNSNSAYGGGK